MKSLRKLFAALLLVGAASLPALSRNNPPDTPSVTPLRNIDVLKMAERKIAPEVIVETIKSSPCNFDTFPPVMQDLKRRGVADDVLRAMMEAPYGPPVRRGAGETADAPIYHYAEQLRQFGLITTAAGSRNTRRSVRPERARATRSSRRRP
jgi:hypothetical protein